MKIIGLTGRAGSGKDTISDHLVFTYGFIKVSLAEPLRYGIAAMFGISSEEMAGRESKEAVIDWIGKSPRQLLQTLGTEWGRNQVADDIWLRVAGRRIDMIQQNARYTGAKGVVVSDIRFANEAAWLRGIGTLAHVIRAETCLQGDTASHASETGVTMEASDWVINNQSGLVDLYRQVDLMAQGMA